MPKWRPTCVSEPLNVYTTGIKAHGRLSRSLIKSRYRIRMRSLMKYAAGLKDVASDWAEYRTPPITKVPSLLLSVEAILEFRRKDK